MKNILTKHWLGPIAVFAYTLCVSLYIVIGYINPFITEIMPSIQEEAKSFLPITIENGEITQPKDVVIKKKYTFKDGDLIINLDTRTDTLDINKLTEVGFYISKKCMYMISDEKSQMRCFDPAVNQEPITINEDQLNQFISFFDTYFNSILVIFLMLFLYIGFYIVILFFTLISHWIVALLSKTTFGQTLFINTFLYILLSAFEYTTSINVNFLITAALFVLINVGINSFLAKTAPKETSEQ